MSTAHLPAEDNLDANGAASRRPNTSNSAKLGGFVRRAQAAVGALPSRIDERMKAHPGAALAIACGVGAGLGIIFSSRIVRSVLTSVATIAAVDLTRALLRQNLPQGQAPSA
jgi:hypothetical protein